MWVEDKHYYRLNKAYLDGYSSGLKYRLWKKSSIGNVYKTGLEKDIFADGFRAAIEDEREYTILAPIAHVGLFLEFAAALLLVLPIFALVSMFINEWERSRGENIVSIGIAPSSAVIMLWTVISLVFIQQAVEQKYISIDQLYLAFLSASFYGVFAALCFSLYLIIDKNIAKFLVLGWQKNVLREM